MEEEGHGRAVPHQGQQQALVLLPHLLPLPQGHDLGARGLHADRVQEPQAVSTYVRS